MDKIFDMMFHALPFDVVIALQTSVALIVIASQIPQAFMKDVGYRINKGIM